MEPKATVRKVGRVTLSVATLLGVIVLAYAGEHLSPPAKTPAGGDSRKKGCDVDAPKALHAAAKRWCADGLFSRVAVTGDDKNVIAVMQFTPNGAQTWELQSGILLGEFRNLSDQMAAEAAGKNLSIALHDAADRRVGACARATTDAATTCGTK